MSGINRLINSVNTVEGNDEQTLKDKLMDGTNAAIEATKKGFKDAEEK